MYRVGKADPRFRILRRKRQFRSFNYILFSDTFFEEKKQKLRRNSIRNLIDRGTPQISTTIGFPFIVRFYLIIIRNDL